MVEYLVVVCVVFAVNLLPAFGPPTWTLLVFFALNTGCNPVALVVLGAVAAASGRVVLALGSRRLGGRLSAPRRARLAATRASLLAHPARSYGGLALFAISPLPSGQLFVAAGLLEVPLVPVTAAFFAGRLVSYSLYVAAAHAAQAHLGAVLGQFLGSPLAIAVQLVLLVAVTALPFVDWSRLAHPNRGRVPGD